MDIIVVNIADYKVAKNNCTLVSVSLGSCVGIALYDSINKTGGLAHIMLPDSSLMSNNAGLSSPNKFADTAIKLMLKEMEKFGALKCNLTARITGGACMFKTASSNPIMNIGVRNIEAVKKVLAEEKIPIIAEDVGKNYGRTIEFMVETGKVLIKSAQYGTKEI